MMDVTLVLGVGGNDTRKIVEELQTRGFFFFIAILSVSPFIINLLKKEYTNILKGF
jgi:hypothetical protein